MTKNKLCDEDDNLLKEVVITFFKSSGPGGQRKNKRETAVRIFHPPTGITVIATEHRSQARNKELAFERLKRKLEELRRERKPRLPTKKPTTVRERELEEKKKHSQKKRLRRKLSASEYEVED